MSVPACALYASGAQSDIDELLEWSAERFGERAATRYLTLIRRAVRDVVEDPRRPGVRPLSDERPELFLCHLCHSQGRVLPAAERVGTPRHFLLFRVRDGRVEIGRVLHDAGDLTAALPEGWSGEGDDPDSPA